MKRIPAVGKILRTGRRDKTRPAPLIVAQAGSAEAPFPENRLAEELSKLIELGTPEALKKLIDASPQPKRMHFKLAPSHIPVLANLFEPVFTLPSGSEQQCERIRAFATALKKKAARKKDPRQKAGKLISLLESPKGVNNTAILHAARLQTKHLINAMPETPWFSEEQWAALQHLEEHLDAAQDVATVGEDYERGGLIRKRSKPKEAELQFKKWSAKKTTVHLAKHVLGQTPWHSEDEKFYYDSNDGMGKKTIKSLMSKAQAEKIVKEWSNYVHTRATRAKAHGSHILDAKEKPHSQPSFHSNIFYRQPELLAVTQVILYAACNNYAARLKAGLHT